MEVMKECRSGTRALVRTFRLNKGQAEGASSEDTLVKVISPAGNLSPSLEGATSKLKTVGLVHRLTVEILEWERQDDTSSPRRP